MELVGSRPGQAHAWTSGHRVIDAINPTQAQSVALARASIDSVSASVNTGCNKMAKKRCVKSLWGINPGRNWPSISCDCERPARCASSAVFWEVAAVQFSFRWCWPMEMMNDIVVYLTSNGDSWIMGYVDPLKKPMITRIAHFMCLYTISFWI
jgi:hypothetical protein